jgi:hypothetical protein
VEVRVLICGICQFLWCKCSHHGQCVANVNMVRIRRAHSTLYPSGAISCPQRRAAFMAPWEVPLGRGCGRWQQRWGWSRKRHASHEASGSGESIKHAWCQEYCMHWVAELKRSTEVIYTNSSIYRWKTEVHREFLPCSGDLCDKADLKTISMLFASVFVNIVGPFIWNKSV